MEKPRTVLVWNRFVHVYPPKMKVRIDIEVEIDEEDIGIGEAINKAIELLDIKQGKIIQASVFDEYGGGMLSF